MRRVMLLAADIGGTKTLVGLFDRRGRRLVPVREETFRSADHPSFESILEKFLSGSKVRVRACAVGVAGPVVGGRSGIVNLKWSVDEKRLARSLRLPRARVLNDLEATAWGVHSLSARQTLNLTPGLKARPGNAVVIAAGTGLGMAILFWDGARHRPSASEGGHQGLAPRDEGELELLRYLLYRNGKERISVERAVSGPGIAAIYEFLRDSGAATESPALKERIARGDANAAISEAGLDGSDALAAAALDRFVAMYGSVAGDLALVAKATAGVYVAGGIAPKILPKLRSGAFLESFRDKGRLGPFVARVPVRVVLEPRTGLIGAAVCAADAVERDQRRREVRE